MESNSTGQVNDVHNANATHAALTDVHDRWWLPLAIAIPVCIVGIVLVTVLVLIVITCHRSKVKHKQKNSESNGKFNEAAGNHNEGTDTGIFATPYANMDETLRDAKIRPLVLAHSNGSKGGNEIAKAAWNRTQSTPNEHPKHNPLSMENDVEKTKKMGEEKRGPRTPVAELDTGKAATKKDKGPGVILNAATPGGESIGGHDQVVTMIRSQQQTDDIGEEQVETPGRPPGQTDNRKTFVVMYSVEAKDEGRLPLSVNDVIFYLGEERDGWMKGEKKESGEIGWFPRSHVREGMSPLAKRHSLPKMEGLELKEAKRPTIDFTKPTTTTTTTATTTTTTTEVISKADDQYNDTDEDFDDDDDDDDEDYETGIEYEAIYAYRALEYGDLNFDAGDVIVVVEKHESGWWRGYRGDEQGFFPGSYVQLKSFQEKTTINNDVHLKDGELLSSATDDVSRSAAELLPISAINKEDDDDGRGSVSDETKKKRKKKRRSSLGLFLLSLPRKMSVAKTGSLGHDSPDTLTTEKLKKPDKTVKKKKKKTKTTKGQNPSPFVRRSSLAPGPPSGDQRTGVARKNGSETVAKTETNKRDTACEDIGTERLLNGWRLDSTANGVPEPSLVDSINSELKTKGNTDKLSRNINIDDTASQETKLNVPTTRNTSTTAGTAVSTVVAAAGVPSKPVPPRKPNFSGSTPNMASALHDSDECKTKKPKLMAKPRVIASEKLHGEPRGGVGHASREPGSEPPHSAAKPPAYPRFPTGPGRETTVPPVPRELCRSLDSVFPGTETEEEEEEEEELEIVKWLQRKLSEEDAMDAERRNGTTTFDGSTISTNAEEFRRKSPNAKPEFFDGTKDRISFLIEDMFKCGLHEDSYA